MNPSTRPRRSVAARRLFAAGWCALAGVCSPALARAVPVYSLAECLDLAAQQNPDVISAGKRVDAAHAVVIQARAGVLPALTSTGYYQRREQSVATNGGTINDIRPEDYAADVRLTQNLFSSGAVRNRIAAALLAERIATPGPAGRARHGGVGGAPGVLRHAGRRAKHRRAPAGG